MQKLKILNKREVKKILEVMKKQWECDIKMEYCFLMNNKDKIFIVNDDISRIDLDKIRINNMGMYFGEMKDSNLRLSIEGSQLIGNSVKKNILELDDYELNSWVKGEDFVMETELNGFVLIKHKNDFYGTGRMGNGKLFNFVPKARRLRVVN